MRRPLFLSAPAYRQRRLRDAARLLPVAAGLLLTLPLLWGDDPPRGSRAWLYVFGVWAAAVLAAAAVGRRLDPSDAPPPAPGPEAP